MKRSGPLLSIILPTKNRHNYAISTIRGILAWRTDDYELVVQDNSNGEDTAAALRVISDARLRYYHCTHSLDMEENFTQAALHAKGEYLAFIGDDDGVTEEVVEAACWGRAQGLEAVHLSGLASFLWPDVVSGAYGRRLSGALRISFFNSRTTYPNGETEIRKCLSSAGQDFHNLPRSYLGLVRRDCLEAVRKKCGTFFPGPSPDLAGAIATASVAEKIAVVNYPIFISGTGAGSGGGLGIAKRHVGSLEDWPHLPKASITRWSSLVPRLFLGQTIWAEDVVQALNAMGHGDLLQEFNIPLLHASCLCFHPAYSREIMASFFRQLPLSQTARLTWQVRFAAGYLASWLQRLRSLISNICVLASVGTETMIRNINDSEAAMVALSNHLRQRNASFIRCVKG
jgi:hypothetical protein